MQLPSKHHALLNRERAQSFHRTVPTYVESTARGLHADHDRTEKRTKPSILHETAAQDLNPNLDREKASRKALQGVKSSRDESLCNNGPPEDTGRGSPGPQESIRSATQFCSMLPEHLECSRAGFQAVRIAWK